MLFTFVYETKPASAYVVSRPSQLAAGLEVDRQPLQ